MYAIGEICDLLGIKQHVLRYWEKEIPLISPQKTLSGRRIYSKKDLQLLFRLKHLLYERKYTLAGAKDKIWEEIQKRDPNITSRIAEIRGDLVDVLRRVRNRLENDMNGQSVIERLKQAGQIHIFDSWGTRSEEMKRNLLRDLESLELDLLSTLRRESQNESITPKAFTPAPYNSVHDLSRNDEAFRLGERLIGAGKTAFLTVAGGQGSRLGFDGPKGMFPIGPISKSSLFQIFAEKLIAASLKYSVLIPWYIMTSPLNHEDTQKFFEKNSYFGLQKRQIMFFPQGVLPTFDGNYELLLAPTGGLMTNPDGHGGLIRALKKHRLLEKMKRDGVEEIFYFQVDNPLVVVPDPLFLGVHRYSDSQVSSKVMKKAYPDEKLGAIGVINGKSSIIEYSDLDEENMYAKDDEGELLFSQGSIAIHIFNVDFLSREDLALPFHVTRKKVKTLIVQYGKTEVVERAGIKLEMFIFDVILQAERTLFYETVREEEFSPLKNKSGNDSIETCINGQIEKFARYLESCGVRVPRDEKHRSLYRIEISPLFAPDLHTLKERLAGEAVEINGDRLFE